MTLPIISTALLIPGLGFNSTGSTGFSSLLQSKGTNF